MLRLATACIVSSLIFSLSAFAQENPLAGNWIDTLTAGETLPPILTGTTKRSSGTVIVGDMQITLEVTPLSQIADRFGGQVQQWGEAGEATDWLCYSWETGSLWFYSDGEAGDGKPTVIALDAKNAAGDAARCSQFSSEVPKIDFDFAAIGDSSADLTARFGQIEVGADGSFIYESLSPFAERPEVKEWQAISLRETGGRVDAIAVAQEPAD